MGRKKLYKPDLTEDTEAEAMQADDPTLDADGNPIEGDAEKKPEAEEHSMTSLDDLLTSSEAETSDTSEPAPESAPKDEATEDTSDAEKSEAAANDPKSDGKEDGKEEGSPETSDGKTETSGSEQSTPAGMAPVQAVGEAEASKEAAVPVTAINTTPADETPAPLGDVQEAATAIADMLDPSLVDGLKDAGNAATDALHGVRKLEAECEALEPAARATLAHIKAMGAHFVAALEHLFHRK